MNITTKFQPGDRAVRMYLNKVQTVTVEYIEIKIRRGASFDSTGRFDVQSEICYYLSAGKEELGSRDNYQFEGTLFATKEELLQSL